MSKYGIFFNFPHNVRRNPVAIFSQKTVQPNLATSQRGGMLEAGLVIIHKRTTLVNLVRGRRQRCAQHCSSLRKYHEALKSLSRKKKPNGISAYESEDFMNHRQWYFANSQFCKIFFQVDVTAQDRKWSMKKSDIQMIPQMQ